ncbi:MAG: hypothetical protein QM756_01695 [Polyangiaceae bacterium]
MLLPLLPLLGYACGQVESNPPEQVAEQAKAPQPLQPLCWRFQSLTAAIGAAAIDCRGTIGPDSFEVDKNGVLVPTFTSCIPGATKPKGAADSKDAAQAAADWSLLNSLLSFQQAPDLPGVRECVAGRWSRWRKLFDRANIATCPTWEKTEVIGTPTQQTVTQLNRMQPKLPVAPDSCHKYEQPAERRKCTLDAIRNEIKSDPNLLEEQSLANIIIPPKTSATYTVTVAPDVRCADPAVCAAQCAAAFPGFVLAAAGNRVDGDATYWLSDAPPGSFPGIQHEMAQYYGPPGEQFGHVNRTGELCWRWDEFDELVYLTTLYRVVLSPTISVSHCGTF